MFTGIITAIGEVKQVYHVTNTTNSDKEMHITCPHNYLEDVHIGDSIALNGACMTVTKIIEHTFSIHISFESLSKTIGLDQPGYKVNLEKALRLGDHLGGHLVSGHVDDIGTVHSFAKVGESWNLQIRCPKGLAPYLAYKGSIAINGVSLTINQVIDKDSSCIIHITVIPHTLGHTTLGDLKPGMQVNLEVDTLARYVLRGLERVSKPHKYID
jgi:riboflavin synthase